MEPELEPVTLIFAAIADFFKSRYTVLYSVHTVNLKRISAYVGKYWAVRYCSESENTFYTVTVTDLSPKSVSIKTYRYVLKISVQNFIRYWYKTSPTKLCKLRTGPIRQHHL